MESTNLVFKTILNKMLNILKRNKSKKGNCQDNR